MTHRKALQRLCLSGRLALVMAVSSFLSSLGVAVVLGGLWAQHTSWGVSLAVVGGLALVLAGTCGLVGFYLARDVARPVASMQAVLDTMLRGEPAPHVQFGGAPELHWLGVAIQRLRRVYMRHV